MLNRWDPFAEMMHMQDRLSRYSGGSQAQTAGFAPAVDIYEGDNAIKIKAELPGVQAKDVHIDVENNILTLRGERAFEDEEKRDGYHRIERSYGSFFRSFVMPNTVNADAIEATMTNGVLTIHLPKKAEKQPRKISIKSGGSWLEQKDSPTPLSAQQGAQQSSAQQPSQQGAQQSIGGSPQASSAQVSGSQGPMGTRSVTGAGAQAGNGNGHGPYTVGGQSSFK